MSLVCTQVTIMQGCLQETTQMNSVPEPAHFTDEVTEAQGGLLPQAVKPGSNSHKIQPESPAGAQSCLHFPVPGLNGGMAEPEVRTNKGTVSLSGVRQALLSSSQPRWGAPCGCLPGLGGALVKWEGLGAALQTPARGQGWVSSAHVCLI